MPLRQKHSVIGKMLLDSLVTNFTNLCKHTDE